MANKVINLLPSLAAQLRNKVFGIGVELVNPEEAQQLFDIERTFKEFHQQLFLNLVFEIHKYLIRVTPLHTGKLRGGWTGVLDKYQQDYSRQLQDHSLYDSFKETNVTPEHKVYRFDSNAVEEGKSSSSVEDNLPNETDITIDNQVEYGFRLDDGTSKIHARRFTEVARYKGELWFEEHYKEWLEKISAAGAVVPPPDVKEIDV